MTLYWDNVAEQAVDPLTGTRDFEGYKIYRSEDYTFSDVYTITDAQLNEWKKSAEPLEKQWADNVRKAGGDPDAIMKELKQSLAQNKAAY